jgi:glycosyltransferase involved in cell wall biosynthesis
VILEAMAAGCPVVASAVGGNPELVEHSRTGLLFPSDDATALAAALVRVACDPDLRLRFATSAGFRARSEFSIETMVRRTVACYERCLERAAPQHGLVLDEGSARDDREARPRAGAHR